MTRRVAAVIFRSTPHPVPLPKGEGTQDHQLTAQSSPPLWGEGQGEGLIFAQIYQHNRLGAT